MKQSLRDQEVWVTGGAGFIGTALSLELVRLGAKVTVIDSLHPACGGRRGHVRELEGKVRWLHADIAQAADWASPLPPPQVVFNLASHISHTGSERDPALDLQLNTHAQLIFLLFLQGLKNQPRVVYSSTRQVYGETTQPAEESAPPQPPDWNGIHKLAAEHYHLLAHRRNSIEAVILRLPNVYGPRMPADLKGKGCFVGWLARNAHLGDAIELIGAGRSHRDLLYVADAVSALLIAGTRLQAGRIWNVAGQVATIREVAAELIRISGRGRIVDVHASPTEARVAMGSSTMNDTAFRKATGWSPKVPLSEGLEHTLSYLRSNPEVLEQDRP